MFSATGGGTKRKREREGKKQPWIRLREGGNGSWFKIREKEKETQGTREKERKKEEKESRKMDQRENERERRERQRERDRERESRIATWHHENKRFCTRLLLSRQLNWNLPACSGHRSFCCKQTSVQKSEDKRAGVISSHKISPELRGKGRKNTDFGTGTVAICVSSSESRDFERICVTLKLKFHPMWGNHTAYAQRTCVPKIQPFETDSLSFSDLVTLYMTSVSGYNCALSESRLWNQENLWPRQNRCK